MNNTNQVVETVLSQLGMQFAAPMVQQNVQTALEFFKSRMPTLSEANQLGFLRAMDLHSPVTKERLFGGETVAAFRRDGEPLFKLFYTKAGVSPYQLGIVPGDRQFHLFAVHWSVKALVSRTGNLVYASADDAPGGHLAGGVGGVQYIIPDADQFLQILR